MRIKPARAAIGALTAGSLWRAAAGEPGGSVALAFHFGDHLLHRPAWGELDDGEVDGDDAEQGRQHQQQTAQQISGHQGAMRRAASVTAARAGSIHQLSITTPERTGALGLPNRSQ